MFNSHTRPSRDLRNNYSELARIVKDHNQVIITNNGRGEAVLIGIDDYAQYEDFLHRRYIAEALEKAKVQANDPDTILLTPDEVWRAFDV